jgi:rhodanese-related sulfurtransferase
MRAQSGSNVPLNILREFCPDGRPTIVVCAGYECSLHALPVLVDILVHAVVDHAADVALAVPQPVHHNAVETQRHHEQRRRRG